MLCAPGGGGGAEPPKFCPEGFYCEFGDAKVACPGGSWCPTGSSRPIRCGPGSRCPAGSSRETPVLPVIITVLAIALLLVLAWVIERSARRRRAKVFVEEGGQQGVRAAASSSTTVTAFGVSFAPLGLSFSSLGRSGILSDCSGSFRGGRLTVVMGPSGAGKSTLLGLVTGMEDPSSGAFTLGGVAGIPSMRPYRALIGLVPQSDDTMLSAMTVEEVLNHAVDTKMVAARKERRRVVNEILMELGIEHVRACVIGDADDRGLSGGEKKRVSIGVELVARPRVLFLDEPTSGLDAATALSLMRTLSSLARDQNITVVAVLHQPRFEIFELADDLLLLRAGKIVYSGERAGVMDLIPLRPALHENPADFLMDNIASIRATIRAPDDDPAAVQSSPALPPPPPGQPSQQSISLPARPNILVLVLLYLKRALLQQVHGLRGVALAVFLQMLVGISMGIASRKKQRVLPPLPLELQDTCPDMIKDACLNRAPNSDSLVIWVFFMTLAANGVYSLTGTGTFGLEALQWRRERRSGASVLAYHLGKFLSVLPSLSVEAFATCACFHLLASPRASFADNYITLWCLGFSAYAVGHLVSMVVNDQRSHLITSIAIGVAVSMFTGSFPSLTQVKRYWVADALWSIVYTRWAAEALIGAEVRRAGPRSVDIVKNTYGFIATKDQFQTDLLVCVALGVALRVIILAIAYKKRT